MTIRAIETSYAGYRFRSRLEARWAVFFNEAGIRFEYEPEGLRVDTPMGVISYLPDFWLGTGQWGEVKGWLDMKACKRLVALATGMAKCGEGADVVVLGEVPSISSIRWPVQLHQHRGLWAVPWALESGCPMDRPHVRIEANAMIADKLTEGFPWGIPEWAEDGLDAARRARFEFGESG
jgi:hypothetical protein